jgi:hypothetical protein
MSATKNGGPYFRHCTTIIGTCRLTSMFAMGIGVTFRINHRKRPQSIYSPDQGIKFGKSNIFCLVSNSQPSGCGSDTELRNLTIAAL